MVVYISVLLLHGHWKKFFTSINADIFQFGMSFVFVAI